MRGLHIQFEDFSDATLAMNDELHAVGLGPDVVAAAGEWILITFSIGSRSTAAMAVVAKDGENLVAQFDVRDWERIQAFALRSQSPPSSRAPRFEPSLRVRDVHMPSAFPTKAEGLGTPFLQVLHYSAIAEGEAPNADMDAFDATLSSHGMVVESVRTLARCEERLRTSHFHILIVSTTKRTPELALLSQLAQITARTEPRPLVVCLASGAESIDLVRAFEAGADECLTSETSATELAARLTALALRKRVQNPGAA